MQKEVKNNICVVSLHLTGLDTSNGEVKGKGVHEPKAQMAGAYPDFISMKQLGVFSLSPGQNASPLQGYPPSVCRQYPFIHLGEERQTKVPCLREQRHRPGLNPGPPDPEFEVLTTRPHMPPRF